MHISQATAAAWANAGSAAAVGGLMVAQAGGGTRLIVIAALMAFCKDLASLFTPPPGAVARPAAAAGVGLGFADEELGH